MCDGKVCWEPQRTRAGASQEAGEAPPTILPAEQERLIIHFKVIINK